MTTESETLEIVPTDAPPVVTTPVPIVPCGDVALSREVPDTEISVSECKIDDWMERLLDDPEVFRGASGGAYSRTEFNLGMVQADTRIFGVFRDGNPGGFFTVLPMQRGCVEIHTTMGKSVRGRYAICAMRAVLQLLKDSGVRTVMSFCYRNAPHTIWFAKQCGFRVIGSHADSNIVPVAICL